MACGQVTPAVQKTLNTTDSTLSYEPFTDWMPVTGLDSVLAITKVRATLGTFSYSPAVQFAAVRTDDPSAWQDLNAQAQSGSQEYNWGSISLTSGLSPVATTQFFVRFGIGYKSNADNARAQADVTLQLAYNQCGGVVGSAQIHATTPSGNNSFEPVTGWMPSEKAAKVKAAIIASGLSGTGIEYRLAYQKASTSTENPGAWATLQASPYTTAGENNTTELTLTYGTPKEMWVRFGIAYKATGPGAFTDAMVSAAVAVRT